MSLPTMIAALADSINGLRHVAVGAQSPLPATAALLARQRAAALGHAPPMRLSILGSSTESPFTDGGKELFDCAAQGRIDAFFLSGGQIDGSANINLVAAGADPLSHPTPRFPGSFGSAYLYFVVPRVILFREEHSPRTLVERVDFISAPGTSSPDVYRPGGPKMLITSRATFHFQRDNARFELASIHATSTTGEPDSPAQIADATGFSFAIREPVQRTPGLSGDDRGWLRTIVADQLHPTYPAYASRLRTM